MSSITPEEAAQGNYYYQMDQHYKHTPKHNPYFGPDWEFMAYMTARELRLPPAEAQRLVSGGAVQNAASNTLAAFAFRGSSQPKTARPNWTPYYTTSMGRLTPTNARGASGASAAESAETIALNPRLTTRLTKWRDYQAGGGQLDMQGWVKATQGQSWGLGGRSGYADWITRVESTHGNSLLSNRTASLYELYTKDGQFLKYGVSQNPYSRYSSSFMADKDIFPIASGTRSQMITLERQMVTQNPGPLNLEPWANAARAAGRGQ